jgi:hypothetical protein
MVLAGYAHALSQEVHVSSSGFHFPLVNPQHKNMQRLLVNAMGYLKPEHGLVDPISGYPVEGWNQEPLRGLFMRSFTQLTAIGQRLELLANIAAGYADNPYVSRAQALAQLELMLSSLLEDQNNPNLSARGLLVNFLGLDATGRIGPLAEEAIQIKFVEVFGKERGAQIWAALIARGWITPVPDGSFARISRTDTYGDSFFTGALAPFAEGNTRKKIMSVMDTRVVQIIFGDNANLTASAAKSFGALLHPSIADNPSAIALRNRLEKFIAGQHSGYHEMYDDISGSFYFGWNATNKRHTGWEDGNGNWVVGHMDYLLNEFRGPLQFVVQRFGIPIEAIKNCGFKIKPYRMADGRDVYTLATWNGSAFESLGLSLFMRELDTPGWRETLMNFVEIELDYARRHKLPGFLSEAYSGNGVQYTGDIGIPEVAVTNRPRINYATSLYTLGTAYVIAPESIERFLGEYREQIDALLTDHGPWEGYNTSQDKVTELQTTAHTMALILGGIGSAEQNMQRYLAWKGIRSSYPNRSGAQNFLVDGVQWIPWSRTGDSLVVSHGNNELRVSSSALRSGALTVKMPQRGGTSLSNGTLLIRYRSSEFFSGVITLEGGPSMPRNEIFVRFDATDTERSIQIPMPATPGLDSITELVILFDEQQVPLPMDLILTRFEFIPAE